MYGCGYAKYMWAINWVSEKMEKTRDIVRHAIFLPRVIKMEGFKKNFLE